MSEKPRRILYLILLICFGLFNVSAQTARELRQPPGQIMDSIGVIPGMIIGEAGAGGGYMTFPLAGRVGIQGKIFANDILPKRLAELQAEAVKRGLTNIETVEGALTDPLFPVKDLDMIIMVYVLHDLEQPVDFLKNLIKYLKTDAPLVIVEKKIGGGSSSHDKSHFMTPEQITQLVTESGYRIRKIQNFLEYDTIFILNHH